jgi:ABC-type dipeptide/oligopeptide/nickel transport system permease component
VTRTSVVEVLGMPFLDALRAKGLSPRRITVAHVLKNAIIPIVTVIGLDFGSYLNGAVLTETIFGWDGLGRYALEGIIKRDYPVVMGAIIVGTVVFVLVNTVVDVAYHVLDPRVGEGLGGRR